MARVFYEDAYCLGLLYAHIYAGKKMVLKDDLDKFHKIIEFNLKSMNSDTNDMYTTVWYDNDPSIYFASEGKNGEIYYVLYPNFDLDRAKSKYIGCLSVDVIVASQKENALDCLGLQKKEGNIKKKDNIDIASAPTFMKIFLEKIKSGELKIESCPQVEIVKELTEEFIVQQLEMYQKLLDFDIVDETIKEELGPVKKLDPNKK